MTTKCYNTIIKSYNIFFICFLITTLIFEALSEDEVYDSSIYYWTSETDTVFISQSFANHSIDSYSFKPIDNDYPRRHISFWHDNKFHPTSEMYFKSRINNNIIIGVVYVDSLKSLILLSRYKYGINGKISKFIQDNEFFHALEVTKDFEDNILYNYRDVETSKWRIFRNIWGNFFIYGHLFETIMIFIIGNILIFYIEKICNRKKKTL